MIHRPLVLSDIHLGGAVCTPRHRELVAALPAAVDDAELIVLNGDIVDGHRGAPTTEEAELVARLEALCEAWRSEGRRVVWLEGNHDPAVAPAWRLEVEGHHGERILILHGHRTSETP